MLMKSDDWMALYTGLGKAQRTCSSSRLYASPAARCFSASATAAATPLRSPRGRSTQGYSSPSELAIMHGACMCKPDVHAQGTEQRVRQACPLYIVSWVSVLTAFRLCLEASMPVKHSIHNSLSDK